MKKLMFSRSFLKVLSSFLGNLAAGWFIAAFIAKEFMVIIADLLACLIALYLATRTEELVKNV